MSAAAPRAPAPWHRVARAEAAAVLFSRRAPLLLLAVVLLTMGPFGAGIVPFAGISPLNLLMLSFPLLLWRGRGVRGSLDQAVPVGVAPYELIRVGVGAAAALVVLGLATNAHAVVVGTLFLPRELAGFAAGYTAALLIRGLAFYLVGAAIVLRARRPGRVVLAVCVVLLLVQMLSVFLLGVGSGVLAALGLERTTGRLEYAPDGTVTAAFGSSLTPGVALVQLAIAAAVLGASVWLGRRDDGQVRRGRPRGGRLPVRAAPSAHALRVPRAPAAPAAVLWRQMAVLAPRMMVPLAVAAALALWHAAAQAAGTRTGALYVGSFALVGWIAYLWPALVWVDERGAPAWDQAQPAGLVARRTLHALAGLAWLELCVLVLLAGQVAGALAGGTLTSLEWLDAWILPGVPLAVMAMYCAGTLPAVLARRPVFGTVVSLLLFAPVLPLLVDFTGETALSVGRLFAPVTGSRNYDWSLAAALVWLPVLAGLAVAAIRHRAARDQHGSPGPARAPLPA